MVAPAIYVSCFPVNWASNVVLVGKRMDLFGFASIIGSLTELRLRTATHFR